ncbi:hypothetical protein BGZ82_004057 [Podila clonocystis]|nr:hypothetical protein BGZ82_004057 [Podila clonocystis]
MLIRGEVPAPAAAQKKKVKAPSKKAQAQAEALAREEEMAALRYQEQQRQLFEQQQQQQQQQHYQQHGRHSSIGQQQHPSYPAPHPSAASGTRSGQHSRHSSGSGQNLSLMMNPVGGVDPSTPQEWLFHLDTIQYLVTVEAVPLHPRWDMVLDLYLDLVRAVFSNVWVHIQETLLWDTMCTICLLDRKCRIRTRRAMLAMVLHNIPQDTLHKDKSWIGYLHSRYSNISARDPIPTGIMGMHQERKRYRHSMRHKALLHALTTDRLPNISKFQDMVSTPIVNLCHSPRKVIRQDWRLREEVMTNVGIKSKSPIWHIVLHNMRKDILSILSYRNHNHNYNHSMCNTSMATIHRDSTHRAKVVHPLTRGMDLQVVRPGTTIRTILQDQDQDQVLAKVEVVEVAVVVVGGSH